MGQFGFLGGEKGSYAGVVNCYTLMYTRFSSQQTIRWEGGGLRWDQFQAGDERTLHTDKTALFSLRLAYVPSMMGG